MNWGELWERRERDPLFSLRKKGWERFVELEGDLPWKGETPVAEAPEQIIPSSADLLFQEGFFLPERSRVPAPLVLLSLDQALKSYAFFLQNHLSRSLKSEQEAIAPLSLALHGRGAFLYVPPNTCLEEPLKLESLFTTGALSFPRLSIYLGAGSKLTLSLVSRSLAPSWSIGSLDLTLDEGATLSIDHTADLHREASHQWVSRAWIKKRATLRYKELSRGAQFCRTTFRAELLEEEASVELLCLLRLEENRRHTLHALVEHKAPHTRSRQHIKGVVEGEGRGHFEGKIYVDPIAQKTEAYQLSNFLLLSDEALATAQPNLEILADDVKASHGATFGPLDPEALFYLRSRGMPFKEAESALVEGFCREIAHAP